jgi:hypothetical protein
MSSRHTKGKNTDGGIVLSLCDRTTRMVRPWAEAGYTCYCVDIQHPRGITRQGNILLIGSDMVSWLPPRGEYAIAFAFTPCTHLAVSGARWFREKGLPALVEGLSLFSRGIDILQWTEAPYLAENPVGTISSYYRKPDWTFDPCDYAGYLPAQEQYTEAYTKKTCLWTGNGFVMPQPRRIPPVGKSPIHTMPPSADRGDLRSVTPKGFARAVFEANHSRSDWRLG